jgi:hopanoid biosynthesis associated RND transporter like protein HpnN
MNKVIELRLAQWLAVWTDWNARHARWVVFIFITAAAGSLYYAVQTLGINTDNTDMLDETLPFRQTLQQYKKAFPQHTNNLLLVIDGPAAHQAAAQLRQRLSAQQGKFESVYWPGGGAFFEDHALHYLPPQKLAELSQQLQQSTPLLSQLQRYPSASGLLQALHGAMSGPEISPSMDKLLDATERTLNKFAVGEASLLSWQDQLFTAKDDVSSQQLVIVQPKLDYSNLFAAGEAIQAIRDEAKMLDIDASHGLTLRITGSAALAHEELKSVSQGMELAGLVSLMMVIALLWIGTGSFRILLFSILSLLVGLCLTAGFAAFAVGSLNLISVAFAVLYIGLGIDFAIHLGLRYAEFRDSEAANAGALRAAVKEVGSALVLCAVSTAIGFYAFIPTDFIGVSELGLISGTGMFISLLVSLSLLPALFTLFPLPVTKRLHQVVAHKPGILAQSVKRYGRTITVVILSVAVLAGLAVVHARFDYDVLNLRDPQSESVMTYRDLLDNSKNPPWRLTVLADSAAQARDYQDKLRQLASVSKVLSVLDLLPTQTAAKDKQLDNMRTELNRITQKSTDAQANTASTAALSDVLNNLSHSKHQAANTTRVESLSSALTVAIQRLESLPDTQRSNALRRLDKELMGTFKPTLAYLQGMLEQKNISLETLPQDLLSRWISPDGTWRLLVFAREDLNDINALRRFVNEVSAHVSRVTDTPAINLASGEAAVQAFQQAFITALVLISGLLLFLLRSLRDTVLVLLPLLLAGLLTTAAGVILDIPFNFANIITLPLLLGIGVDNGIHMVSRARMAMPVDHNLLHTSTSRAVIISGLTTVASFGNLSFSSHPGTASMGQLLTVGVLLTMVCTLLVLPSLLARRQNTANEG